MKANEESEESTLLDALGTAIELEKYGFEFYKEVGGFVESERGKSVLEFLANQEVEHKEWLELEHNNLEREINEGKRKDEKMSMEIPDPRIVFTGKDEITKSMDSMKATKFAVEVEKKSIEFYSACAQMTNVETAKELFKKLSRFEESHRKLLEENLGYLETEGDWYGYVPILEG